MIDSDALLDSLRSISDDIYLYVKELELENQRLTEKVSTLQSKKLTAIEIKIS